MAVSSVVPHTEGEWLRSVVSFFFFFSFCFTIVFCVSQEFQRAPQGHLGVTVKFAGGHYSRRSAHFKQSTLHLLFCSLFETQGFGRLLEQYPEEKKCRCGTLSWIWFLKPQEKNRTMFDGLKQYKHSAVTQEGSKDVISPLLPLAIIAQAKCRQVSICFQKKKNPQKSHFYWSLENTTSVLFLDSCIVLPYEWNIHYFLKDYRQMHDLVYKGTDKRLRVEWASVVCLPREMPRTPFDVLYNTLAPLGLTR